MEYVMIIFKFEILFEIGLRYYVIFFNFMIVLKKIFLMLISYFLYILTNHIIFFFEIYLSICYQLFNINKGSKIFINFMIKVFKK